MAQMRKAESGKKRINQERWENKEVERKQITKKKI
jgi:hypothetical protein